MRNSICARASKSFLWLMLFHLSCSLARNQSIILVHVNNHPLKLVYQTWMQPDFNEAGEWNSIDGTFNCIEQDATNVKIIESSDAQMPEHFFDRYPDIESIEITHKNVKSIQSTDLLHANSLRRLNVSHNQIENIAKFAFDAAPKLSEIDLSFNFLHETNLNENIFTSYLIKYLYLHNNQLTVVNPLWFENLLYLRVLTLNNNKIRAIDWQLLEFMPNLNVLHLHTNKIVNVTNVMQTPRSLQTFSMHDNPIAVKSRHLIWLDAVAVDIRNIGVQFCRINQRMQTLIAANNEIREINLDNLGAPNQNSLVTLHLANNRLHSIENVTYFHHLQFLNLSHNLLKHIDAQTFHTLNNLQQLDLSHNKLKRFDVKNIRMPSLNLLDVSFNEMLTLDLGGMMSQLEILNIDGNRIKSIVSMMKNRHIVSHEATCISDSVTCHDQTERNYQEHDAKQTKISDDILRDVTEARFRVMEKNILQLIDSKFTNIEQRVRRIEQEIIGMKKPDINTN